MAWWHLHNTKWIINNKINASHERHKPRCLLLKPTLGYSVSVNNLVVDSVNMSPETRRKFITRCFGEARAAQLNKSLYPADVSDELVRERARTGVYKLVLETQPPKHADRFQLSDEGILGFCFGHTEDKPKELKAYNVFVSPQFFDRLVQVNIAGGYVP